MKGISAENQRDLILSVGMHQLERPLSPIEIGELIETAINSGTTKKEISEEIMLDPSMIDRFRRLQKLSPSMQHLVAWREKSKISFSTASEIARLKTYDEQELVGKTTLEHSLSKNEVIRIVENKNKIGKPIDECVEEVLKMRPLIIRRYLFIGTVRSLEVRDRLSEKTQKERDTLFNKVVTSNLPNLLSWNGSLGIKSFSLIGYEDLDQVFSRLPTDFASSINGYLESEILNNG